MAKVVESFWKNKKVFLTGHTGFKGAWLSLWLHKLGAQVTGYSLSPPTVPSLFETLDVKKLLNSEIGNINDFTKLSESIKKAQPEIVIHMAAQSLVKYSYNNPIETIETNVLGTARVLEASRYIDSVKAIVNITSDKCYENQERAAGYKEDEPMGGYDPYSSSKGCAELIASAYRRSFFSGNSLKGLASARAGNVIGGGDWAQDRLLPDIFRGIIANKQVVIRNPNSVRPWQHVLEPLCGYLVLAQKLYESPEKFSEGFNFGPHDKDAQPVQKIVESVTEKWGQGASYMIEQNYQGPHEAHFLKLNVEKANSKLGWKPTWNLDKALDMTVDWMKAHQAKPSSMLDYSLKQIDQYERDMNVT